MQYIPETNLTVCINYIAIKKKKSIQRETYIRSVYSNEKFYCFLFQFFDLKFQSIFKNIYINIEKQKLDLNHGLPWWLSGKESAC